jgi:hypothetical protein
MSRATDTHTGRRIPKLTMGAWQVQTALRTAIVILVLVVAAYLRIVSAQETTVNGPIRADAKQYVTYAVNMKAFHVYSNDLATPGAIAVAPKPGATSPPGYPLFLRMFMGDTVDMGFVDRIVMIQAWLGIVVVALGMALAMLLLGFWPGVAAGIAMAVNPHMIVFTDYLLTETLYSLALIVFLSVGVVALGRHPGRVRVLLACVSGITLAIACLIRPTLDQFALALLLLSLATPWFKRFRREIVLLVIGWSLLMAPWWIRNESAFGHMSDPRLMVAAIHTGSYPDFMLDGRPETSGNPYAYDPRTAVAESSLRAALGDVGQKFVEHPWRMLRWYLIEKPFYLFKWTLPDGWGDMFTYPILRSPWLSNPAFILLTSIVRGLHWPLVLLGMMGAVLAFTPAMKMAVGEKWRDSVRWLATVQVFMIAVHVAGSPFPRYSVPFRPLLFILAMFSVVVVVRWVLSRREGLGRAGIENNGRRALP